MSDFNEQKTSVDGFDSSPCYPTSEQVSGNKLNMDSESIHAMLADFRFADGRDLFAELDPHDTHELCAYIAFEVQKWFELRDQCENQVG